MTRQLLGIATSQLLRRTFSRDVLPILFVELDLRLGCLFDHSLDALRLERGVSAQQDICDDPNHGVNHQLALL